MFLLLLMSLMVCALVGFIVIAGWIGRAFSGELDSPPQRPAARPAGRTFSPDAVCARLQALYIGQKMSLEAVNAVLQVLGLQPAPPPDVAFAEAEAPASSPPVPLPARLSLPPEIGKEGGLLNQGNVRTMLISGSALVVLGAYLFVRAYWTLIPDALKFAALAAASLSVYLSGRWLLSKGGTPRTAETLLVLGLALFPLNVVAADFFVLDHALGAWNAWALGLALAAAGGAATASALPGFGIGALIGACVPAAVWCAAAQHGASSQELYLAGAASALGLAAAAALFELADLLQKGLLTSLNAAAALLLAGMAASGFFLRQPEHWQSACTLLFLGAAWAVQARVVAHAFAYPAGLCFLGAGAVLLHDMGVPVYRWGLCFVPAALASILRAWTFERAGRKELAAPYFHLGQAALAGSLLSLVPSYSSYYLHEGFGVLMLTFALAALAYALVGALYPSAVYTYAGAGVLLLALGSVSRHEAWFFVPMLEAYCLLAWIFLFGAFAAGSRRPGQLGLPLEILGLGTLTLCAALFAAAWAEPLFSGGAAGLLAPPEQAGSGIAVGLLCLAGYSASAWLGRRTALVYPALASATLVYLLVLQKLGAPIDLLSAAWPAAAAAAAFYICVAAGWDELGRCFAVWADAVFAALALRALAHPVSASALPAVLVCAAALLPSFVMGVEDLAACGLLAVYLAHYLYFSRTPAAGSAADYAMQLVGVNCAVVFARTAISLWKPSTSVRAFRILAAVFCLLSMLLGIGDASAAWKIYGAYGLLALAVSMLHYEGRLLWVGTALLVVSYEFFLSASQVKLTEAYSVPAGGYLLVLGWLSDGDKARRTVLYAAAQVLLYLPSFLESVSETWELHGVFLGVMSLALMVAGMQQRNKTLAFASLWVMLADALVQSRQFLCAVPRWIYLGLGGACLLTMGGLFEFQREQLLSLKNDWVREFDAWD